MLFNGIQRGITGGCVQSIVFHRCLPYHIVRIYGITLYGHESYFNFSKWLVDNCKVKCSGVIYFPRGIDFTVNKMIFWKLAGWRAVWEEGLCVEHWWDRCFLIDKLVPILHRNAVECTTGAAEWRAQGFMPSFFVWVSIHSCFRNMSWDFLSLKAGVIHLILFWT